MAPLPDEAPGRRSLTSEINIERLAPGKENPDCSTGLAVGKLAEVKIPVPSPEEQRRIAGILDAFGALVNDPDIGLPAELNARQKQYEHYRDRLLTFKELAA